MTTKKTGLTLVEMLIYVSVLSLIVVVVIYVVYSFTGSYRQLAALRAADYAGVGAMDRMTRDIREASDMAVATSTSLSLTHGSSTILFYKDGTTLKASVDGTYLGPLTASNAQVESLAFTPLVAGTSTKAVKIDLTVRGIDGPVTKTKTFHTTVILKGL